MGTTGDLEHAHELLDKLGIMKQVKDETPLILYERVWLLGEEVKSLRTTLARYEGALKKALHLADEGWGFATDARREEYDFVKRYKLLWEALSDTPEGT